MDPVALPEEGESAGQSIGVGERDCGQDALDRDGVGGEAGWRALRDGHFEVGGPAETLGVDPFVFVCGGLVDGDSERC